MNAKRIASLFVLTSLVASQAAAATGSRSPSRPAEAPSATAAADSYSVRLISTATSKQCNAEVEFAESIQVCAGTSCEYVSFDGRDAEFNLAAGKKNHFSVSVSMVQEHEGKTIVDTSVDLFKTVGTSFDDGAREIFPTVVGADGCMKGYAFVVAKN